MSTKRPGEEDLTSINASKYARTDENVEFSGSGGGGRKKASGASTRTGQACDRCKIRKIRCDARPGGCSPCIQNNTECKTTDRITGRATSRGHTETVENENASLRMYIVDLQAQLRQAGVEPPAAPNANTAYGPSPTGSTYAQSWEAQQNNGYGQSQNERQGSMGSMLPEYRPGCIGDNYLGVASENNWLSPIEGTSLALFGTKIDLAEFMPAEPNPDASAMSYQTFLAHAFGNSFAPQRPDLPAYEQCKIFAEWYFRSVQIFTPVLHKPDFMQLLTRIYHQGYQPSPAETVNIHMMLAIMNFQWYARNGSEQSRSASFEHYHYALSFVPQLITGHKLEDIQALTMICCQLRNQPRPGAAWMFTNMVFGLAIELGLHRSAKAWSNAAAEHDPQVVEMRKRIFWSLMVLHISLGGKLGRPMPVRFEDFDIELPEPVDDNLPSEANLAKWRKCSFRAAIEGFKLLKIVVQVYSTIYSVRSASGPYDVHVRQIEKDLRAFQAQVPPELSGGPQTQEEDRIGALYLKLSEAECQLLLHHPSLCRSNSPQVAEKNLDVCLEASNTILISASHLKQLKSLDTTWYYGTTFLASIFTTLFAYTEKRDKINSGDLQRLRQDMDAWLDIMGEIGRLLGTGPKLQEAIRGIIDYSINNINRHLTAKTASAAIASVTSPNGPQPQEHQHHQQQMYGQNNDYYSAGQGTNGSQYPMDGSSTQREQSAYPSGNHFTYPEPQTASMPQYSASNIPAYDTSAYNPEDIKPNIEAALTAELARTTPHHQTPHQQITSLPQQSNFMAAFQSPVQTHNSFQSATTPVMQQAFPTSGPAAWRHFADNLMPNMVGQDQQYANALMSLGAPATKPDGTMADVTTAGMSVFAPNGATFGGMQMPLDGTQSWPLIHYNSGAGPVVDGSGQ